MVAQPSDTKAKYKCWYWKYIYRKIDCIKNYILDGDTILWPVGLLSKSPPMKVKQPFIRLYQNIQYMKIPQKIFVTSNFYQHVIFGQNLKRKIRNTEINRIYLVVI